MQLQRDLRRAEKLRNQRLARRGIAISEGHALTEIQALRAELRLFSRAPIVEAVTNNQKLSALELELKIEGALKPDGASTNIEHADQVVLTPIVRMPDNGRDPHLQLVNGTTNGHALPASNGNGHEPVKDLNDLWESD